jgi:hypothetical protein
LPVDFGDGVAHFVVFGFGFECVVCEVTRETCLVFFVQFACAFREFFRAVG